MLTDQRIEVLGADTLADMIAGDDQRLTRNSTRLAHQRDLFWIFDLDHTVNFASASTTRRVVSATSS